MSELIKKNDKKKEYVKPQVTEVRLVAQEAVLAICKINSGVLSACGVDTTSCTNQPAS